MAKKQCFGGESTTLAEMKCHMMDSSAGGTWPYIHGPRGDLETEHNASSKTGNVYVRTDVVYEIRRGITGPGQISPTGVILSGSWGPLSSSPMTIGTRIPGRAVRMFLPSGIEKLNSRTRVTKNAWISATLRMGRIRH